MITGLRRVVKAGFIGFWRSAYVSLASIFVITVALFVIGSTMFLDQVLSRALDSLQSKVDINVYFVPDAPQEAIESLRNSLSALPDVASVTYTSREDALRIYRERNQDDEIAMQALEELDENPLGANLAIQARQTSQYEQINRFLDEQRELEQPQTPVIDEVNYGRNRDAIDKLTLFINALEKASLIVMSILLLAAGLITFNTIRLAIYTAREEIAIMRLVGAGNMFIRGPFMLQGVMYGFISAVLAVAIFYPIMVWMSSGGTPEYLQINLLDYYTSNFGTIFGILVSIGVVLGLTSSVLAVARYLRT